MSQRSWKPLFQEPGTVTTDAPSPHHSGSDKDFRSSIPYLCHKVPHSKLAKNGECTSRAMREAVKAKTRRWGAAGEMSTALRALVPKALGCILLVLPGTYHLGKLHSFLSFSFFTCKPGSCVKVSVTKIL